MEGLMRWLEGYVASTKGADCRKSENDETVTLYIKVPAQGDYSNDYLQFSAIDENDTRQTYVFSKEDGRTTKVKLALRNDNQWRVWEVDGGI